MKLPVLLILPLLMLLAACSNDNGCKPVKPESEEPQMIAFAAANGMNATKHPSGLYYEIIDPGNGVVPNLSSKIWVVYTGKHMNGVVFDQTTTPATFPNDARLRDLIQGWQIGLQMIQKGGRIKLIIPSSLAFGCSTSSDAMPPNSVVYFDIQLIDVQ